MSARRLLLISDQFAPSEHSAVEGIFGVGLPGFAETAIVEFSRDVVTAQVDGRRAVFPLAWRNRGLVAAVERAWPGRRWEAVIVRNKFTALRQFLAERTRLRTRVGFWLSFPHAYRRLEEALLERRAVWRKRVEYVLRDRWERRLLRRCDFFLPITATLVSEFYPRFDAPWQALPMGVDFAAARPGRRGPRAPGPLRFAYTGTVDALRRLDVIVEAFRGLAAPFAFEVYSGSDNEAMAALRSIGDPRFRVLPARPRAALFDALANTDVGIGLIPDTRLYRVGSPTKTLEYAALGLVPLLNPLPDYREVFDDRSAVFCAFDVTAVRAAVGGLLALPVAELESLGVRARNVVRECRDYRVLAADLVRFLDRLPPRP